MSLLSPLLEIQELDLAADAARKRSETLSERQAVPTLDAALVEIDARLAGAESERSQLQAEEAQLGQAVSEVAGEIESAELERYSGKRLNRDESTTHDESQRLLRERKESIEEREMELLESLEEVESRIEVEQAKRSENRAEAERFRGSIRKVESEVVAEIERLEEKRMGIVPSVPPDILKAYDRVRAQPRAGGRGAALLANGRCGACRIKLPSHEKTKMLAEPEDALIQCPQCRRILVR
jgi:predicted  nucleic acid-binding Zn-ribbon protein